VNVEVVENNNQIAGVEGKVGEEIPSETISSKNSKEGRTQDEENSDKNQN